MTAACDINDELTIIGSAAQEIGKIEDDPAAVSALLATIIRAVQRATWKTYALTKFGYHKGAQAVAAPVEALE